MGWKNPEFWFTLNKEELLHANYMKRGFSTAKLHTLNRFFATSRIWRLMACSCLCVKDGGRIRRQLASLALTGGRRKMSCPVQKYTYCTSTSKVSFLFNVYKNEMLLLFATVAVCNAKPIASWSGRSTRQANVWEWYQFLSSDSEISTFPEMSNSSFKHGVMNVVRKVAVPIFLHRLFKKHFTFPTNHSRLCRSPCSPCSACSGVLFSSISSCF